MNQPHDVHTEGNAVPLDGDLEALLNTLTGVHPILDRAVDAFRDLLGEQHDIDTSQTLVAALAGWENRNFVALAGRVIQHLSNPDTTVALRQMSPEQQKLIQMNGETTAFVLGSGHLAQFASDTAAAIDGL
jgi:hypothetical protein